MNIELHSMIILILDRKLKAVFQVVGESITGNFLSKNKTLDIRMRLFPSAKFLNQKQSYFKAGFQGPKNNKQKDRAHERKLPCDFIIQANICKRH